jgi:hypothetical protein
MNRATWTLLFLLTTFVGYSQDHFGKHLDALKGIWVAEPFLDSFESTKSAVKSKSSFDGVDPVALRLNPIELENEFLNIGYSTLHDHILHPEVSKFVIVNKDTVYEQGHFSINTQKSDSLTYHETSEIYYFNYECRSYLTWVFEPDTTLVLYRPASKNLKEKTIRFRRVAKSFEEDNQYPNPMYYYSRSRTVAGNYILFDSLRNTISSELNIGLNGKTTGFDLFENKSFFFSTDVYCGPEEDNDLVLLCEMDDMNQAIGCEVYVLLHSNLETMELYKSDWVVNSDGVDSRVPGKLVYQLTRK